MNNSQIHIYEENINLFWGLLGLLTIASGTYLLAGAFFAGDWRWAGIQQIGSLLLFAIGFYAVIQLTSPLYNFKIYLKNEILNTEIWQGKETHLSTNKIAIDEITEIQISPHTPRKENEALFDFSTDYHLLYRAGEEPVWQPFIELENHSFTLKVEDIRKIMRFLERHNAGINISENQPSYFKTNSKR